jgi:hypothetical protein
MTGPIALEQFGGSAPNDPGLPDTTNNISGDAPDNNLGTDIPTDEIDPEAEQAACLARISGALEIVASEQAGLRAQCIGGVAAALGTTAETLLPRLARAGFSTLVAETAQTIARRGKWPELVLTVAPANADGITSAVTSFRSETEIRIVADPALGPGEVQIAWSEGGAEIDVEAIARAALELFQAQLNNIAQSGAN